jgi:hypothetical protein
MNLFYLDEDHDLNAQFHVDKHVSKMVLEVAEMICMAHWVSESVGYVPRALSKEEYAEVLEYRAPYKADAPEDRPIPYIGQNSHLNHPSTIWVRSSSENYDWAINYMAALETERRIRNPRGVAVHKSYALTIGLGPVNIKNVGFTKFALAMKAMQAKYPQYYNEDDPISSYRYFYMLDKATFATWKVRGKPYWWDESIANYEERL